MGKEERREEPGMGKQSTANPKGTRLHSVGSEAIWNMSKQEKDKVRFIFSDSQLEK